MHPDDGTYLGFHGPHHLPLFFGSRNQLSSFPGNVGVAHAQLDSAAIGYPFPC